MNKEKTKMNEQDIVIDAPSESLESVKVGEVLIQSSQMNATELCQLLIELIQQEPVKEYLGLVAGKQKSGSYLG
jgi:hypothetical protein